MRISTLAGLFLWAGSIPFGAQSVLSTSAGEDLNVQFGQHIANAFDVDGDGFDDVIIGMPQANGGAGRVLVVSGRTGAGMWHFSGHPNWPVGQAVCGIGDLDGDGLSEFAHSRYSPTQARVIVRRGLNGDVLYNLDGSAADGFGLSLAGGGDADGDGEPELLVGMPGAPLEGLVRRYCFPNIMTAQYTTYGLALGSAAEFGTTLAWIGDTDGDGKDDFVVGDPLAHFGGASDVGKVHCFNESAWRWTATGPYISFGRFGDAIASGGDITGDGLDDVIVGAPHWSNSRGRVAVVSGANGLTLLGVRTGDAVGDEFGASVAGLGDVDGDGTPDILVGAPEDGTASPGFTYPGEVHVLSGADMTTIRSRGGFGSHAALGTSVAALGDLTGDGVGDFAASAPYPPAVGTNEPGYVYLFDTADHRAACAAFGFGTAGTLGVPGFSCSGPPWLGATIDLTLENSSGATSSGAFLAGTFDGQFSILGGTLFTAPTIVQNVAVPPSGASLPVAVPQISTYSGSRWILQGLQLDPGAPGGVSFSRPLRFNYGGW